MCDPDSHGINLYFNPRLISQKNIEKLYGVTITDVSKHEIEDLLGGNPSILVSRIFFDDFSVYNTMKISCNSYSIKYYRAWLHFSDSGFCSNSIYVLALAWAKHIHQQFNTSVFFMDAMDRNFFLFDKNGLTISESLQKDIIDKRHPIFSEFRLTKHAINRYKGNLNYEFMDLIEYGGISPNNISDPNDIILHTYKRCISYYFLPDFPYYENLYKTKKTNNNPRLRYFCNMPHIQYFVEDSNWTYQLTSNISIPTTTITYRADTIWRDAIILATIEDQYLKDQPMILTTATGEIIFILENNHFKIDKRWQSYFSTFPLQKEYKVDKNLDNLSYSFIDT